MISDHLATPAASRNGTVKFPELSLPSNLSEDAISESEESPSLLPVPDTADSQRRWHPQRRPWISWAKSFTKDVKPHSKQKSLNQAFRNIKNRRASVSENAHELAEALKVPVSPRLVMLCCFWFMTSIFSNASSKSILIAFRHPVTLTVVQFAFVSSWCIISSYLAHLYPPLQKWIPALRYSIRPPSKELILATLPLTAFQIGGHILNSDAMSRIPVSLVHTIKGLSPLFTVFAYRLFFRARYSIPTYLSLIPLTIGVIMACSANFSGDFLGLLYAFGSTVLFVTQNIASKKLFNEAARAESEGFSRLQAAQKPDKLNLLCYSSGLAFLFTFPIWVWSEGLTLLSEFVNRGSIELSKRPDALDHGRLALEFIFNGTFHFAQSLVAFILLSMISPVTYSVASLVKRVFVITFAIVWFGNPVTRVQRAGILVTFVGLYLYDRTNDAARVDKRVEMMEARIEKPLLPMSKTSEQREAEPNRATAGLAPASNGILAAFSGGFLGNHKRRNSDAHSKRPRDPSPIGGGWLAPGTKQERTWSSRETQESSNGVPG